MGKARVCVVELYGEISCVGHKHVDQDEARAGVLAGKYEWMREPQSSTSRGMVLVRRQPNVYKNPHIEARGNDANAGVMCKTRAVFLPRGTKFLEAEKVGSNEEDKQQAAS